MTYSTALSLTLPSLTSDHRHCLLEKDPLLSLYEIFATIPDPRSKHGLRYELVYLEVILGHIRLLRNLADVKCGTLKICVALHPLRFLQTIHLLGLMVLPLVLSVMILFTLVEHSMLEKIDFSTTIHASFNEFEPVHIAL